MGHLSARGSYKVKTVCVDNLVDQRQIPPPQLVKIDIEGAEGKALRGMLRTLKQYMPVILLETHGEQAFTECDQLLQGLGYYQVQLEGIKRLMYKRKE